MSSSYGTRRSSALQQQLHSNSTQPTAIPVSRSMSAYTNDHLSASSVSSSPLLSSSAGKQKRPSTLKARRLSTSQSLRPPVADLGVARSLPTQLTGAHAKGAAAKSGAGRKGATSVMMTHDDGDDDGEIKPGSGRREKGITYECEKCSKLYKHSACLQKHRWEHTEQWQEASKLLLSKHQQVQLLEAAAILQVASAGASLPQDKAYWPAAVSPPSAGLLGSQSFSLQSPRMFQSLSLHSDDTPFGSSSHHHHHLHPAAPPSESAADEDSSSDVDEDEDDRDDDEDGSDDESLMDEVDDGMFDLDLGGGMDGIEAEASPPPGLTKGGPRSDASDKSERTRDSGFGSVGKEEGEAYMSTRSTIAVSATRS